MPQFVANIESLNFKDLHYDFTLKLDNKVSEMIASKGRPHIQSTKKMIGDITSLRSLYSLDEYHPPAEIERYEHLDTTFQSSREFDEIFRKAKVKLSSSSNSINNGSGSSKNPVNFETFVNNSKEFDHIKTPYSSIDELWPDIPVCVDPQMQEERTLLPGGVVKDSLSASNVKIPQEISDFEPMEDLPNAEERIEEEEDFFSDFETKMDVDEVDDLEEIAMNGNRDDDEDNGGTTAT